MIALQRPPPCLVYSTEPASKQMGSCITIPAADSSSRETRTRHTSANFRSAQCTAGGGQRSARINPARVPRAQVVSRAFKFAQQQCFRRSLHSALCKALCQCSLVTLQMTPVPACMLPESVTSIVPIQNMRVCLCIPP